MVRFCFTLVNINNMVSHQIEQYDVSHIGVQLDEV